MRTSIGQRGPGAVASRASAVSAPVLVVVAGEDEIIPRARSEALVAAFAPGQVQVVVVPDVGHNTLDASHAYLGSVGRFLHGAGGIREPAP